MSETVPAPVYSGLGIPPPPALCPAPAGREHRSGHRRQPADVRPATPACRAVSPLPCTAASASPTPACTVPSARGASPAADIVGNTPTPDPRPRRVGQDPRSRVPRPRGPAPRTQRGRGSRRTGPLCFLRGDQSDVQAAPLRRKLPRLGRRALARHDEGRRLAGAQGGQPLAALSHVTPAPTCVNEPPTTLVTCCPPSNAQLNVHGLRVVAPWLRTVIAAMKPFATFVPTTCTSHVSGATGG